MLKNLLLASALALAVAGPAAAQTPIKVKFGVLTDMSGIYADATGQGSVIAAQMAIEDFGAAQKGITAEVVGADHQNKPDVGANIARQWFDQDGVDVILDTPTSSVALAVTQIAKDKNKIFLNSGAATSDLTGPACTPNTIHWTYDTWALARGTGGAMVAEGGDTWFFITADYAFGHTLEKDTTDLVVANGGKVVGGVRAPFPTADFSSFLLQAQASRAKVIGLANAGGDTINSIKQAGEFGITQAGQRIAGLLVFDTDIHSLGLRVAQGLVLTAPYYWDRDDATRAFAARYEQRHPRKLKPTFVHAGVYSAVTHYLKAAEKTRSTADGAKMVEAMKAIPTDDPLFGKGEIRADGRKIHQMYLYQVKTPAESKGAWDYNKLLRTIPTDQAFRPLKDGGCPLVKS